LCSSDVVHTLATVVARPCSTIGTRRLTTDGGRDHDDDH
jgi:hypothetical protein